MPNPMAKAEALNEKDMLPAVEAFIGQWAGNKRSGRSEGDRIFTNQESVTRDYIMKRTACVMRTGFLSGVISI